MYIAFSVAMVDERGRGNDGWRDSGGFVECYMVEEYYLRGSGWVRVLVEK